VNKKLKPCPFCGETNIKIISEQGSNFGIANIMCKRCGCRLLDGTQAEWNNRILESKLAKAVEALELVEKYSDCKPTQLQAQKALAEIKGD